LAIALPVIFLNDDEPEPNIDRSLIYNPYKVTALKDNQETVEGVVSSEKEYKASLH
jgi:hypothetical protein